TATDTSNNVTSQVKHQSIDKTNIIEIFKDLKLDQCRTLSTGTALEDKMKAFTLGCNDEQ
ncbi:MAG: hypothetical protein EXX96DRAFT_480241, partial [Benjaminiella poitrasii]